MRTLENDEETDRAVWAVCRGLHGSGRCACSQRGRGRCESLDTTTERLISAFGHKKKAGLKRLSERLEK